MYCPDDDAVAEGCWESRYQRVWDNSAASILPVSEATAKREQLQGKGPVLYLSPMISQLSRVYHRKLRYWNTVVCGKSAIGMLCSLLPHTHIRDACSKPLATCETRY